MAKKIAARLFAISLAMLLVSTAVPAGAAEVTVDYLYNLSDFTGVLPYYWARVVNDDEQAETYVTSGNAVDIFDRNGMLVYEFLYDDGAVYDSAALPGGDILLLTQNRWLSEIVRCNYRGEPKSTITLKNIPAEFSDKLRINRMEYRNGELYLADLGEMRVIVVDMDGNFLRGYDVAALLQLGEEDKRDTGMSGFSVDREGDFLFTIAATAKAAYVKPDGMVYMFGKRGSGTGKMGVPSGIAADEKGNLLVADKLRCVVLVYDKGGKFKKEFGFRGFGPGNLIVPSDIAIDGRGRVYVSQLRARGVSIYQLGYK
jgi:hypothetical protein